MTRKITPDATATETTAAPTLTVDGLVITTDTDAAVAAYGDATTGQKTKIRNAITEAMKSAIGAMDLPTAQAWVAVTNAIEAASKTKNTPVTDYSQTLADRIIALHYAAHRLTMGDVLPEGMPSDEIDMARVGALVSAYLDAGDRDAVSNDVATAGNKMATAKITRSVERGSVEDHLTRAFADLDVDAVLTVAQVRTRSGAASDGAIAARLWPSPKKDGTARETSLDLVGMGLALTTVDGVRAIRKVA